MSQAVILADGLFPSHNVPLGILNNSEAIICCDGSAASLDAHGLIPLAIVGDMDSLDDVLRKKYADRIYPDDEQETNDLTKAVAWCRKEGYDDLLILGATGKREDHTIGNISLLAEYAGEGNVKMLTDSGIFLTFSSGFSLEVEKGQQISIFSLNPATEITSEGLAYPLKNRKLTNWWQGTLNEATGNTIKLDFDNGTLILFVKFPG